MALHQMSAYRSEVLGRGLPRSPVEQERVSVRPAQGRPGAVSSRHTEHPAHLAGWAWPRGCSGVLGPSFQPGAYWALAPCLTLRRACWVQGRRVSGR